MKTRQLLFDFIHTKKRNSENAIKVHCNLRTKSLKNQTRRRY